MRKASIVERSACPETEKAEKFEELVSEAGTIRERMEASFKRLSAHEMESLGPGRRKEIAQLTEMIMRLKTKHQDFLRLRDRKNTIH
jgi:hypothetical protein